MFFAAKNAKCANFNTLIKLFFAVFASLAAKDVPYIFLRLYSQIITIYVILHLGDFNTAGIVLQAATW